MRKPRTQESVQLSRQEAGRAKKIGDAGLSTACNFFQLISEFVGHQASRGHPQYNEGDLTVSLATARHVEVWQLGLRSQGVKFCSSDPRVFVHCVVDISKGLDGVALTTEVLTYPVETLSPFSRQFCLRGLQLLDCLVMTFALFVEVRTS